jgi:hypothetical protein
VCSVGRRQTVGVENTEPSPCNRDITRHRGGPGGCGASPRFTRRARAYFAREHVDRRQRTLPILDEPSPEVHGGRFGDWTKVPWSGPWQIL